jgi:arabinogalactan oligomer/maltooligosaccharide transport system permease protein
VWLGLIVATTFVIFVVYIQPWHIPIKYLLPGTIFLIAFQVIPVVATFATSFTNFGDAHRGSKADAVVAIQSSSVQQVPGSAQYVLTIATNGDPKTGDVVFLLY